MPSQSLQNDRASSSTSRSDWITIGPHAREAVVRPLQVVSFWSAIALPFLYIPLLLNGLETTAELQVFLALVALNLLALMIGHGHKRN